MTRTIMTVNGPISPDSLGHCQCHEHILLRKGTSWEVNPALCMDNPAKSLKDVTAYAAAGGSSLIDAQPGGCCRMEKELSAISLASGVNIIASTGFHKLCFYPPDHWIRSVSQEKMYEFIVHELTSGMFYDIDRFEPVHFSPCRAGIIKCAFDREEFSPVYTRLFKAAAKASVFCDVPIMVHMEQGVSAGKLLDFLLNENVRPERIILCHLDRSILSLNEYSSLLQKGVFLEFDTIGRFKYHDDLSEIKCIRDLADLGYLNQLLLSLDTTSQRLKSYHPDGIGLDYLFTSFLPGLRHCGFSDDDIFRLTVTNCKNVFI